MIEKHNGGILDAFNLESGVEFRIKLREVDE